MPSTRTAIATRAPAISPAWEELEELVVEEEPELSPCGDNSELEDDEGADGDPELSVPVDDAVREGAAVDPEPPFEFDKSVPVGWALGSAVEFEDGGEDVGEGELGEEDAVFDGEELACCGGEELGWEAGVEVCDGGVDTSATETVYIA